jgi:hypothetical protein
MSTNETVETDEGCIVRKKGLTTQLGLWYHRFMSYPISDQINYTLVSCPPGKYQAHDIAA